MVRRRHGKIKVSATNGSIYFVSHSIDDEKEAQMICEALERLESRFRRIRAEARNPTFSDEQKEELLSAEAKVIMDIKEHQSCGHEGKRCFSE